jgi:hypothetical protein
LFSWYSNPSLRTNESLYGIYPDDELISWTMDGYLQNDYFKIFKHDGMVYYGELSWSKSPNDMAIRESMLNERFPVNASDTGPSLEFADNFQPLISTTVTDIWLHNVSSIRADELSWLQFRDIFANPTIRDLNFTMAWIVMPVSAWGDVYPFVEYMIDGKGNTLADVYYTIQTEWYVGNYKVTMMYKKPVSDSSIAWDFTVFF